MTFATSFLMAPAIPQWMQAIAVICTVIGFLIVVTAHGLAEGTPKRLVMASVAAFLMVVVYAGVAHAAIYVGCDHQITWLDWVWWVC